MYVYTSVYVYICIYIYMHIRLYIYIHTVYTLYQLLQGICFVYLPIRFGMRPDHQAFIDVLSQVDAKKAPGVGPYAPPKTGVEKRWIPSDSMVFYHLWRP